MKTIKSIVRFIIIFLIITITGCSKNKREYSWKRLVREKDSIWYASDTAINIAENVLLYQRGIGGWPKNKNIHHPLSEQQKEELRDLQSDPMGSTTDNGATTLEMLFLSKLYKQVKNERYKEAFLRALGYLLAAQYENGGWPQFYPHKDDYSRYITYNDNSMANIMKLLYEVGNNTGFYSIVPDTIIVNQCKLAYIKGIDCILNTQYKQNGILTGWCAQHDEKTLEPAKARSYELPSLSGKESADLILLLMKEEQPSERTIYAVNRAAEWVKASAIKDISLERYKTVGGQREVRVVKDTSAALIWARFMDLNDNTPIFSDRDGIIKSSLDQIGHERRVGYAWYSRDLQEVLDAYPAWKNKWSDNGK